MSGAVLDLVVRYRKGQTYGIHALLAALEVEPPSVPYEVHLARTVAEVTEGVADGVRAGRRVLTVRPQRARPRRRRRRGRRAAGRAGRLPAQRGRHLRDAPRGRGRGARHRRDDVAAGGPRGAPPRAHLSAAAWHAVAQRAARAHSGRPRRALAELTTRGGVYGSWERQEGIAAQLADVRSAAAGHRTGRPRPLRNRDEGDREQAGREGGQVPGRGRSTAIRSSGGPP